MGTAVVMVAFTVPIPFFPGWGCGCCWLDAISLGVHGQGCGVLSSVQVGMVSLTMVPW